MKPLAALFLILALPAAAWAQMPERCATPDSLHFVDAPLPNLAGRLKAEGPVRIMVLGTSSSMRDTTQGLPRTYVAGLPEALSPLLKDRALEITNLSQRTQSVVEMRKRILAEVVPAKPDLLLWQTGAVEAGRQMDVNTFGEALIGGLEALRAARIDVVLIGPQHRPRLTALVDPRPVNDYMNLIAERENVPHFPRYEIMLHWAENGSFDGSTNDPAKQVREAEMENRCLALALAQMIQRAVATVPK